MKKTIYVQLLNEGSVAYRPVSAYEIGNAIYRIDGSEVYDPEDEEWEFAPGIVVEVQNKILNGESVLIAMRLVPNISP